jgi:hypothetical protein
MKRVWLAVRRTVDQKILGFIRVPEERSDYSLSLKPDPALNAKGMVATLDRVTLRIEFYTGEILNRAASDQERAIYSTNDKIEFWRRVPGFHELKDADRFGKEAF